MFMNFLVYRIGGIGDTVIALPALWAIRKAFPEAKITYLTNSSNSGALVAESLLPKEVYDEIISYSSYFEIFNRLLTGRRYDALFYLMNRNRSKLRIKRDKVFFGLVAGKIYGMKYLEQHYLPMKPSFPLKEVESEYDYLLNCIYSEKISLPSRHELFPDLKLKEEEKARAIKWLNENCGDWKRKRLIGVMVSSGWKSKNWAEKKFIEVLKKLVKERKIFPIIFGGKEDFEQGRRIVARIGTGAVVAGKLGARGDAALLGHCKLYLGTDTGTMHLAGAVGTRCVAIFSGVDYPGRWVPFGKGHKIIRKRVKCEGCFRVECPLRVHECLEQVSVEEVYEACVEVLGDEGE